MATCGIISAVVIEACAFSNGIPIDSRNRRIAELEAQLRERDRLITALQEKVQHLEEELEKTKRAGKRQATPFARKKRVGKPKRPGRKIRAREVLLPAQTCARGGERDQGSAVGLLSGVRRFPD